VFFAALLAAALAAASVGSAATAKAGKTTGGVPLKSHKPITNTHTTVQFGAATVGKLQALTQDQVIAQSHIVAKANRPTRGRTVNPTNPGNGPAGLVTAIPHIHSTPIVGKGNFDASAQGLNMFWQEATHGGGGLTPPDQALGEGNGYVVEAVNDNLIVTDTNLRHPFGLMTLEQLMFPDIAFTGEDSVGDPRVYYDQTYNRWVISTYATDFTTGNSAIDIAVSLTGNPAGGYALYFIDTTNDGTDCTGGFGCFGDQPLLGADNNVLVWSTNSYNNSDGALNGAQLYVVDKAALMGLSPIPTIWYMDVGGTQAYPGYTGLGINTCGVVNFNPNTGYCLSSFQPATSPNASYNPHFGGTEFGMASLDPLAGQDNRIIQWFLTGTVGVSFAPPSFFWYVMGSESYGYPFTGDCVGILQLPYILPGVSASQCGYAVQPPGGNLPFCDYFFFGPGCEPGGIQADDDRMNAVVSITGGQGATVLLGGLNTDALVSDPLGVLHRRDAVAWFAAQGFAGVFSQGYIGNWQNDVLYPTVTATVASGGTHAVAALDVTGNNLYPSFALAKFNIHSAPTSVQVGVPGQDSLDDFCADGYPCGFPSPNPNTLYRPRYGDYTAAVADGTNVYVAGEYSGSSCDEATWENTGFQCNPATSPITPVGFPTPRGFASNWATGILKTHT
jgi:hypothetical protein